METERLINRQNSTATRNRFGSCTTANAWKYAAALLAVAFILFVQFSITHDDESTSENLNLTLVSNSLNGNGKDTVFVFQGKNEDALNYTIFPGFSTNTAVQPVTEIRLINVALEAHGFSKSLQEFTGLEVLYLDNVTFSGKFSRVYLPRLKSFTLNHFCETENTLEVYDTKEKLHSDIFFDKTEGMPWEVNEICNLGVEIFVTLNGFKLIQISRDRGDIELSVPYCNDILQSTNGKFESLSLSTCNVTKSSFPNSLKFLNLFDVNISDGIISEILDRLPNLTDLYYDVPGETIDLAILPGALKFLSLSSVTLTFSKTSPLTNVQQLTLGFCNCSAEVYDNFNVAFPSLQRIAAFGRQSANYKLLDIALRSNKTVWILMEEFDRFPTTTLASELDATLANLSISNGALNFLIKKPKYSNKWIGSVLTNKNEQNSEYRYSLLGWAQFLTFSAYKTADKYDIEP